MQIDHTHEIIGDQARLRHFGRGKQSPRSINNRVLHMILGPVRE